MVARKILDDTHAQPKYFANLFIISLFANGEKTVWNFTSDVGQM